MDRNPLLLLFLLISGPSVIAQDRSADPTVVARNRLISAGISAEDLAQLRTTDSYVDARTGVRHTWLRQQWLGIDIRNSEIAVHQRASGEVVALTHRVVEHLATKAGVVEPGRPEEALRTVLDGDSVKVPLPVLVRTDEARHRSYFAGDDFSGEAPFVELVWLAAGDALRLCWNVNYYMPDGSHWWNVRIDARTSSEIERNDWVAACGFEDAVDNHGDHGVPKPTPAPAAPNDYRIYPLPIESPNHGARALRNAPWTLAPIASPFGWHDTNGVPGAEYTITRGNTVWAQEDANANNGIGYSPNSATLDFDHPLNLGGVPATYQDAAITNLFFQTNVMHDVFYRYGFDEVSGNFQSNNYGRGGVEGDWVYADAQDGSGTNNANFATPPDGTPARQQMFLYTFTTPGRDSDLDNGIVTHEYGHGISRRLVAGPSNVDCLDNQDQMGEGWSDYLQLMMTMKSGDLGTDARGVGTYLLGQPITGAGVRPLKYTTDIGVNNLTYASTNSSSLLPNSHGVGTAWCTMLWDLTWDLIDLYGFDPDLYNGNAGNNIALQLVIDGMKYTPSNPGFVDARNGILMADQITFGGAYKNLIWAAFAARGLGFSASQGNPYWRFDAVEAFDLPVNNNVGVRSALSPAPGRFIDCQNGLPLSLTVRNNGLLQQGGFNVNYRLDGGAVVTQTIAGTILPGFEATVTFPGTLTLATYGAHTIKAWTSLASDQYHADDTLTIVVNWQSNASLPLTANAEDALAVPPGWIVQNIDGLYTWSNVPLAMGANCAATRAFRMNYRTYLAPGQEDRMVSPLINLAGSAGTRLQFHHSYAPYGSGFDDGLRVEISTNCGNNWTTLYTASGSALGTAPQTTATWVPTLCSHWQFHDIDLGAYDGHLVLLRFVGVCGFGNDLFLDNIAVLNTGIRLAVKVMLEGAYDSGTLKMRDDLRNAGLLPTLEPYSATGFAQAGDGGGEVMQSGATSAIGDNAIVDWVLVELRNPVTPATIFATRAALLQRDGDVVAEDGISPISLLATAGSYYVAVRHRNHLGAMTNAPVALSTATTSINFTNTGLATYGVQAQKTIGAVNILWAGNAKKDLPAPNKLKYTGSNNDRDAVLIRIGGVVPTATVAGYHPEDNTMDGVVKYTGSLNDRDPILVNIGGTVPTNTRTEQLP